MLRSRSIDDKSNAIYAAGVDSDAQMFKSGWVKSCLQFDKPGVGRCNYSNASMIRIANVIEAVVWWYRPSALQHLEALRSEALD